MSRNWLGLAISAAVLLVGVGLILAAALIPSDIVRLADQLLGAVAVVLAVILLGASLRHLMLVSHYARKFPPPGRLIDVGGYRMHYVAAGEGTPTVIWIPGSHSQGLALNHLHKRTAEFTRSLIFDRPSSGWSDIGPFPRTVLSEARELETLLRRAGERPPFVVGAHSFGGALATTFAELFPEQVAGLVLIDITTADATVYGNSLQRGPPKVPGLGMKTILGAAFGLHWTALKQGFENDKASYDSLADVAGPLLSNAAQPRSPVAFRSALQALWREPLGTARGQHVLSDIPIFAIIPPDLPFPTVESVRALVPHVSEYVARGYIRNYRTAQESVALLSRRGEIRWAPPNSTHAVPYEAPDFIMKQMADMVALVRSEAEKRREKAHVESAGTS